MVDYKKLNILVLDDQKSFTDIFALMLMDVGVGSVRVFNAPDDALNGLKTFTPNIIISDIEMGEKDGFQFIQEALGEYPQTKLAEIVFLTLHSNPEFMEQAKDLGVSGYLLKPVSPVTVRDIVTKTYNSLFAAGRL